MKRLKNISIGFLMLSLFFSCGTKANKDVAQVNVNSEAIVQPPNIVFILSDDQAWTDYSFMGHEQIETPRLDKFPSEAITFQRGYVPTSLCSPSLATIITGLYPKEHGILGNDVTYKRTEDEKVSAENRSEAYKHIIPQFEKLTTLPDLLKEK